MRPKTQMQMAPPPPIWKLASASGPYVKLAALSGAAAVILGAMGSHSKQNSISFRLNLRYLKIPNL